MLEVIFYAAIILTIYTYLVFPILLRIFTNVFYKNSEKKIQKLDSDPSVIVICALYNEEKIVTKKIQNFLDLDYENIKMYVGSDGSTDRTNELLRKYAENKKIKVFEFPRRGKVHVINDLMEEAQADILVFTDANWMFDTQAIRNLVKYFSDPRVGAVSGKLKLIDKEQVTGEGFYQAYESAIKKAESQINCVIGASGAIYAVRKKLLKPLPPSTINDDFTNSMRVLEKGYGIKYAEDAMVFEQASHNDFIGFKRHIRDGAGHYRAIVHLYWLLNPLKPKVFFLYLSHRVIRWFVPIFLLLLIILPWFMELRLWILLTFILEMFFYGLAIIGWITKTKFKLFYIPYFFVSVNLALLIGFFRNILGLQQVAWDRTERYLEVKDV